MSFRRHLTYANVMATIAVFGVLAGGSAYAISKIGTADIKNGAISAKKLRSEAVKTAKLGSEAVTGEKLADGAVGKRNLSAAAPLAMAGVEVYNGEVRGWFNRFNDERPTLQQTGSGVYDLTIPGIDEQRYSWLNLLSSVSLVQNASPGEVTTNWTQCSASGCLRPIIYTFDSNGNAADRSFTYLVYYVDHVEI